MKDRGPGGANTSVAEATIGWRGDASRALFPAPGDGERRSLGSAGIEYDSSKESADVLAEVLTEPVRARSSAKLPDIEAQRSPPPRAG